MFVKKILSRTAKLDLKKADSRFGGGFPDFYIVKKKCLRLVKT